MGIKEYNEYVDKALEEAEIEAEDINRITLSHEEVFGKIREKINKAN